MVWSVGGALSIGDAEGGRSIECRPAVVDSDALVDGALPLEEALPGMAAQSPAPNAASAARPNKT